MNPLPRASNPFATRFVRPGALAYRFEPVEPDHAEPDHAEPDHAEPDLLTDLVEALVQHRVAQVVGPHGTGKSTLLHSLRPRLQSRFDSLQQLQLCRSPGHRFGHWVDQRRIANKIESLFTKMPETGLLIIDGAEQLGRWRLRRLVRRALHRRRHFLFTCHVPLRGVHRLFRTSVNPETIRDLSRQLTAAADDSVRQRVEQYLEQRTFDATENVRELFFELYDLVDNHRVDDRPLAPSVHLRGLRV